MKRMIHTAGKPAAATAGVIHSSVLNPRGSWNAALCLEGNRLLMNLLKNIASTTGKQANYLAAFGAEEVAALEALYERKRKGLEMRLLTRKEMLAN
jgi:L-2-hydroxyglutarate oxidase LhgO